MLCPQSTFPLIVRILHILLFSPSGRRLLRASIIHLFISRFFPFLPSRTRPLQDNERPRRAFFFGGGPLAPNGLDDLAARLNVYCADARSHLLEEGESAPPSR